MATGTITSPWTPVSAGPPAADTNGSGSDTKNLDVGDISDVSILYHFEFDGWIYNFVMCVGRKRFGGS